VAQKDLAGAKAGMQRESDGAVSFDRVPDLQDLIHENREIAAKFRTWLEQFPDSVARTSPLYWIWRTPDPGDDELSPDRGALNLWVSQLRQYLTNLDLYFGDVLGDPKKLERFELIDLIRPGYQPSDRHAWERITRILADHERRLLIEQRKQAEERQNQGNSLSAPNPGRADAPGVDGPASRIPANPAAVEAVSNREAYVLAPPPACGQKKRLAGQAGTATEAGSTKSRGRPKRDRVNKDKLIKVRGEYTQEDFAGKCDVSLSTIQRGEAGQAWEHQTFQKVAETVSQITGEKFHAEDLKADF
jgi:hypothetical protein